MEGGSGGDPWPRRLLLVGVVLMAVGLGAFASGSKAIEADLDPTRTNVARVEAGTSVEVDLTEGGMYAALRPDNASGSPPADLRLIRLSDGADILGFEPDWRTPSRTDANRTVYDPVRLWTITEAGPHLLENEAESSPLHLVDESVDDRAMMASPPIILGCLLCLGGLGLLPLAALVQWLNRRAVPAVNVDFDRAGGVHFEEDVTEEEVPDLTPYLPPGRIPTTDEVHQAHLAWSEAQESGLLLDSIVVTSDREAIELFDSGIAAPFADRPDPPPSRPVTSRPATKVSGEKGRDEGRSAIEPQQSESGGGREDGEKGDSSDWKSWDEG